jgi:hypothetical protein
LLPVTNISRAIQQQSWLRLPRARIARQAV